MTCRAGKFVFYLSLFCRNSDELYEHTSAFISIHCFNIGVTAISLCGMLVKCSMIDGSLSLGFSSNCKEVGTTAIGSLQ